MLLFVLVRLVINVVRLAFNVRYFGSYHSNAPPSVCGPTDGCHLDDCMRLGFMTPNFIKLTISIRVYFIALHSQSVFFF